MTSTNVQGEKDSTDFSPSKNAIKDPQVLKVNVTPLEVPLSQQIQGDLIT